jgi:hypothetical protein
VAHACNSRYSRGRDQEDCSSKPAQGNSSGDPISEKTHHKKKKERKKERKKTKTKTKKTRAGGGA